MQVRIVAFAGCPNHEPLVALIEDVARDLGIPVAINTIMVTTNEQAVREKLLGSPTVQVDGVDIEPDARSRTDYSMSCRIYSGPGGLPPREMIAAALGGHEPKPGCCGDSTANRGCC